LKQRLERLRLMKRQRPMKLILMQLMKQRQ
jgi:hypothetical protein